MRRERRKKLIFLKNAFLIFFGICAGSVIAAGVYAFLAMIGVFVRLMGRTNTGKRARLYERCIVAGGILGNASDIYEVPLMLGRGFGTLFLTAAGLSVGVFVGCLAMSLAETLKALPTISRRIGLAAGLQYLIFSIAAGKFAGACLYFWKGMSG